jgi:hypothetical protein
MEYLMTYGWAILIIAVVLAALFSLGVFSSGSLLGTSCVGSPGYQCTNPVLSTSGNVAFTFGQNTGSTIYNVGFICAAITNSLGPYITAPGGIGGNLEFLNSGGTSVSSVVPSGSTGFSLLSGQTVALPSTGNGVVCYASTGNTLAVSDGNPVPVGTAFSGSIWMNYTTSSGTPGTSSNPWYITKIASVTVKVS